MAISLNLTHILETPGLDRRALEAVVLLVGALALSLAMLAPAQPFGLFRGETLAVAVVVGAAFVRSTAGMAPVRRSYPKGFALKVLLGVLTVPPYAQGRSLVALSRAGLRDAVDVRTPCEDERSVLRPCR